MESYRYGVIASLTRPVARLAPLREAKVLG
jgi:hypothetical protein